VSSSTSISATAPGHAAGSVSVDVANPDGLTATLGNGFSYTGQSNPAPTVSGISPNSGSTSGGTSVTISGTNFLPGAGVLIGGLAATQVSVATSTTITAATAAHSAGPVDVVVTNSDSQSATLTAGYSYVAPAPPQGEIVLYASDASVRVGNWQVVSDPAAAGGSRMWNPDHGVPKITAPSANPPDYFEITFNADASRGYRIWMRGKAQNDSPYNDSVHLQFSDSVDGAGAAIDRIGTNSGEAYNLEECSGCGLSGW